MQSYLDLLKNDGTFDFVNNKIDVEYIGINKQNKTFIVEVKIENVLTFDEYKVFVDFNNTLFKKYDCKLNLRIKYENNEIWGDEVISYFTAYINNYMSIEASELLNYKISIKDNKIIVAVDSLHEKFREYKRLIEEGFENKYGLSYRLEFIIDDELESKALEEIASIEEERLKEFERRALAAKEEASKREDLKIDNKNKKYIYSLDTTKIKDIPSTNDEIFEYENNKGEARFSVQGEIFFTEVLDRGKNKLAKFKIYDGTDSLLVKKWINKEEEKIINQLTNGVVISCRGKVINDTYEHTVLMMADKIEYVGKKVLEYRSDDAPVKRVELSVHTKMSNLDGIASAKEYIEMAVRWGHKAMAFTDHNGVNAIPDINHAAPKDFKPMYGCELDYINDPRVSITYKDGDINLKDATFVVFDVEATGLTQNYDDIIEMSAYKLQKGVVIEKYEKIVKTSKPIPEIITNLTSITKEMTDKGISQEEFINEFVKFAGDSILVAHNASYDIGMVRKTMREHNIIDHDFYGIDTANLARAMYGDVLSKFNLKALSKYLHVKQEHHHRANDDTRVLCECFILMLNDLYKKDITNYKDINSLIDMDKMYEHIIPKRINVIAKNQVGYKNMYKLLSDALTEHVSKDARLLKSVLEKYREGVLVLSGGAFGELFDIAYRSSYEELEEVMKEYDVVEVQPPSSFIHIMTSLNDGHDGKAIVEDIIRRIIKCADSLGKIVCATSDCYYLEKSDKIYRDILIASNQVGGGIHELRRGGYKVMPDAELRTTGEMLKEFSFLGEEVAYKIVVENTNKVCDMCEPIKCFHDEMFVPADDEFADHPDPAFRFPSMIGELKKVVAQNVLEKYGENPHPFVSARVEREQKSIISSGYYSTYFMAYLMVKDSLENGYLVGSRGSVGSSFVATMMNITEVNPLPPHYLCPKCKFMAIKFSSEDESKIVSDEERELQEVLRSVGSGYDLPDMACPRCGSLMDRDGQDIPFETFLGFNGDKVPDIDLNFSGEYQAKAHLFVRKLMGYDNSFRGGTVGTIAEKNAAFYIKSYLEATGRTMRQAEMDRIGAHLVDIKRTTGQHPGGIVVVPKRIDIYDVTPIQYPANDKTNAWRTTHFDYHAFENNLLKLDILGHDDPTLIKYFMDIVHTHQDEFPFDDPRKIPICDPKIYSLFGSTEAIGVTPEEIDSPVASYAVPEFGTQFVRGMLIDTKPQSFAGLVKISGLSHGTDVWLNNAKDLVGGTTQFGKIKFDDIIGCRDDIMVDLLFDGLVPIDAFKIMEFVRKGKVSKEPETWAKYKEKMQEKKVPEWYIWSCEKIKYMFPKAHACAYVLMAMRVAWFKVYKPAMFYSAFLSKRAAAFDVKAFLSDTAYIKMEMASLQAIKNKTAKDDDLITSLGVTLEAKARGIKFLKIDINKSDATTFLIEGDLVNGNLRIPFAALDGLGPSVAQNIVERRAEKEYTSIADIKKRAKINDTLFAKLMELGAFDGLPLDEEENFNDGLFAL